MKLPLWIFLFLAVMLLGGCRDFKKEEVQMKGSKHTLEEIRAQHEDVLMTIPGVVGLGTGICKSGKECLKIYTSVPADQVRGSLPEGLKNIEFELEYVGDIKAQ